MELTEPQQIIAQDVESMLQELGLEILTVVIKPTITVQVLLQLTNKCHVSIIYGLSRTYYYFNAHHMTCTSLSEFKKFIQTH